MENTATNTSTVIEDIAAIVGAGSVLTDEQSCSFYAQDIYTRSRTALAVVQPASTTAVSDVVAVATKNGHAVIARGGGMSYTSGYVPAEAGCIMLDMSKLNRVWSAIPRICMSPWRPVVPGRNCMTH